MQFKVLIIDDDPIFTSVLVHQFKQNKAYQVKVINARETKDLLPRIEEVLHIIEKEEETGDFETLILVDLEYGRQDKLNGFDVLSFIFANSWKLTRPNIIVMSSNRNLLALAKKMFPAVIIVDKANL